MSQTLDSHAIQSAFASATSYRPLASDASRGAMLPRYFGEPATEYRAVVGGAGLFDRSHRALLEVRGKDRKTWLHNLVTNAVKTLDDFAGNYAFAVDVRGRTHFDLNILSLPDRLWLDIDLAAAAGALAHFQKFLIMEDAVIRDASAEVARLGVAGPRAVEVAGSFGAAHMSAMSALGCFIIEGGAAWLVRHDFAGLPGFELIVARPDAAAWWERLAGHPAVTLAGEATLDVLRTEAGIPWLGRDIDEKTIPPETGQVERGISYHKGCYLGQEVIERMRSHGSLARRLMRLAVDPGGELDAPVAILNDGAEAGRVTTLVRHPVRNEWIGLGYLRTAVRDLGGLTCPLGVVRMAESAG